jgi:hypothetical protein
MEPVFILLSASWWAVIAVIILLVVKRRNLKFLTNRYYIGLELLSIAWWLFLLIGQLRTKLVCDKDDNFCNSGNTFWGDFTYATMLTVLSLSLIWLVGILIGLHLQKKQSKIT